MSDSRAIRAGQRLLTIEEAAARLRTTPGALRVRRHRGQGPPAIRPGRSLLFPEDLLDEWLSAQIGAAMAA
jgi:excisionase family DNA binding protein